MGRTKICVYYVRTVRTIVVKPFTSIGLGPYERFGKPYESRTNGLSHRTKASYGINIMILLYLSTSRTKPYESLVRSNRTKLYEGSYDVSNT